jgi:hypothetical protein
MREAIRLTVFVLWCGLIASCAMPAQDTGGSVDRLPSSTGNGRRCGLTK